MKNRTDPGFKTTKGKRTEMEPFLDDKEDEQERLRQRLERIERMRREKQLQEERRRILKKALPWVAGAVGVILIIGAALVMSPTGGAGVIRPMDVTMGVAQNAVAEVIVQTGASALAEVREPDSSENISNIAGNDDIPIYKFESTEDTVTVYSEEVISTNVILIDESTDTIIASKGAEERISPASMTKVLTVLVAAEHIAEEDLDDTFTMTLEITDYAYVNDCSSVGFLNGEEIPVRDLFYGTVLPSGADAAVGLATYVAGSHEAFVDMMNEKLEELGLADTAHFTNCVGLYDEDHYCTVYDMAVIMKAAMQNELCREVLSAHSYTTTPTEQHPEGILISNWFLRRIEDKDTGGQVICAKTGYVVQSKNCAVSYGTFAGGTPYICVTAGSTSSWRCIYDHVEIYTRYVPER